MIEIPNYTIEGELGRGGMATVYLAVQEMLSRHVALKVMLPDMARDENFRKSFLSEGKIIANLEHTNIVRVHDVGIIDDSILYMAMENLSGGTLKERLVDRSLSYAESLRILEQVASGLSYAHGKGYIHRDVKPGNILFRENGTAVLTDFGIAKLQDTSGELTRMGYTMGTVQYMSPEQAVTTDLDQRSDVYSLGLVFYEMLTGQKAFKAESTIQAIHQHTTVAPPALPEKYGFLQETIDKVLAKDPDDRYQTINEFIEAVGEAADVDKTVIRKIPVQNDLDKTQILRPAPPQRKEEKKKSKAGLIAGILGGGVFLSALLFGAIKYPDAMPWAKKSDVPVEASIPKKPIVQEPVVEKIEKPIERLTTDADKENTLEKQKQERSAEIKKIEDELQAKTNQEKQDKIRKEADRKLQEKGLAKEKEQKKLEQETIARKQEEKRLSEIKDKEERRRLEDARKQGEEERLAKIQRKIKAEEERLAKIKEQGEKARLENLKRQKEADRLAVEAKKQEEVDRLAAKTKKQEEESRLAAEAKRQEDDEKARLADQKRQEEQEQAELDRQKEEKHTADLQKKAEAERLAKEKKAKEAKEKLTAKQREKDRIAKQKKLKRDKAIAVKKAAEKKRRLAKKKAADKRKRLAAIKAKKIADAKRRQQQLARSKAHIRVSATLNGRPLKTSFVLIQNGKRVQTVSGRTNANFTVRPGRYTLKAQYGGQVGSALVSVGASETAIQQFAFKTRAPARAPTPAPRDGLDSNWEHEHLLD